MTMDPDLLRQRRNLITISAVLLVFDFAEVTITKISILGTELLVGDAKVLMVCAWVLWAYFFMRYYQYWRTEDDKSIRNEFQKKFDKYAREFTKAVAVQDTYGQRFDNYRISRTGFASWTFTLQGYNIAEGKIIDGQSKSLPPWQLLFWSLKAGVFVCFATPHATDHLLPFALAIAAPITTIVTKYS